MNWSSWARSAGALLASDECYLDLGWEAKPQSVLHPEICGASHDGVLGVFSVSKRSNLAGYRAGFVAGDPALIAELLEIRKHAGMIVPGPVQAALTAALSDDAHAEEQYARYARRREILRPALENAGLVSHSEAGLYLWATHADRDCWRSVNELARAGILVSPGAFDGAAAPAHVRVALTATDERIGRRPPGWPSSASRPVSKIKCLILQITANRRSSPRTNAINRSWGANYATNRR